MHGASWPSTCGQAVRAHVLLEVDWQHVAASVVGRKGVVLALALTGVAIRDVEGTVPFAQRVAALFAHRHMPVTPTSEEPASRRAGTALDEINSKNLPRVLPSSAGGCSTAGLGTGAADGVAGMPGSSASVAAAPAPALVRRGDLDIAASSSASMAARKRDGGALGQINSTAATA